MKRILFLFGFLNLMTLAICAEDHQLALHRALPIDGPENNQPSGLTLFQDTLFAVSDHHDGVIYRIDIKEDHAVFVPYLTFDNPDTTITARIDQEGITCDQNGDFYLVSERGFRLLKVSRSDGIARWVGPDMKVPGEAVGLFATRGAGIEGIISIASGRFLVTAERQPRGLIEIDLEKGTAQAFNYNASRLTYPEGRATDFTGLWREGDVIFALQRGAEAITQVRYGGDALEEIDAWSFDKTVNRDDLRYKSVKYGKAEGLAMDASKVYVILDTNGESRLNDAEDKRSMLLIFKRP